MRILVLVNNFPWPGDGDGTFNLRAVLALRERGHDVLVVRCIPYAPPVGARWQRYHTVPRTYQIDGISVQTLRVFLGPRNWGIGTLRMQVRSRLQRIVAAFGPDVAHVHGLLPAGLLGLCAGVPYVLTAHGSETYRLPWSRRQLERLAREVVAGAGACAAVSAFVAQHLQRLGAREVRVVFNGADDCIFAPRDRMQARAGLHLPMDLPTIVFAGHLEQAKGVRELVTAATQVRDLRPSVAFAGTGSLERFAVDTLEEAGIEVRALGFLAHERLAHLMAAADVFVLPSYAEGLPTVICEAMNMGRAVIATRVGGIPEIVRDGETGMLVEPRDVAALASALRTLLDDRSLQERFEHNAARFAQHHLTWRINAAAYEAIYLTLIERRSADISRASDQTPPQMSTSATR